MTVQYYYKVNTCGASNDGDEDCICWHNEGEGPCPLATPEKEIYFGWRVSPKCPKQNKEVVAITKQIDVKVDCPQWKGTYSLGIENGALYISDGEYGMQFTKEVWLTIREELDKLAVDEFDDM